jgi:hypothetical protein
MKKGFFVFVLCLFCLSPGLLQALPPVSALHGSWGFTFLNHYNTNTWKAEGGRVVFNPDGSGNVDTFGNNNGSVGNTSNPFTYSASANPNGTLTLNFLAPGADSYTCILSDSLDMIFVDGTQDLSRQWIGVLIRLKDAPYVYVNMDFKGDYNVVAYEHVHAPVIFKYKTSAFKITSNGLGAITGEGFTNDTGAWIPALQPFTISSNYTFATFNSPFLSFVGGTSPDVGTIGANGNMALWVQRGKAAPDNIYYGLYFALKREARTYSNADLSGKWIVVGFGDSYGTGFGTLIGAMHCDNSGQCRVAMKTQFDGLIEYIITPSGLKTVAADGTFGSSYGPSSPSYAAVIGNNGNTLYLTNGFDADPPPNSRMVMIGLRCNDCAIPLVHHLPLILRN